MFSKRSHGAAQCQQWRCSVWHLFYRELKDQERIRPRTAACKWSQWRAMVRFQEQATAAEVFGQLCETSVVSSNLTNIMGCKWRQIRHGVCVTMGRLYFYCLSTGNGDMETQHGRSPPVGLQSNHEADSWLRNVPCGQQCCSWCLWRYI